MAIRSFKHAVKGLVASAIFLGSVLAPAVANACMPSFVDFDFGSARLSASALATVTNLASDFRSQGSAGVRLIAQTDGSEANMRMSRRRAQAVKTALVGRGVPARAIVIETRGPSHTVISSDNYARVIVMDFVAEAPTRTTASVESC